eukprot:CAMPEP_0182464148 /NCGR_PEP_ID=MMETSP1319-20130603/8338_1 /TAXON_ID=172717 /ORGANISM="Bolidomonas pacifica, Strain RCC208" /LENGTH=164 /DNA_ID=CAMNT_0024663769 /DNA_START=8 /DNA_END=499 /DNA_ORIENTATION=+
MIRAGFCRIGNAVRRDVNWDGLTKKITDDGARAELGRMRQMFDDFKNRSASVKGDPAAIDWDHYRSRSVNPEVVNYLEEAYGKLQVPSSVSFADLNTEMDDSFKVSQQEAQAMITEAKQQISRLEADLRAMRSQQVTADTSLADMIEAHPELVEEAEKEINEYE